MGNTGVQSKVSASFYEGYPMAWLAIGAAGLIGALCLNALLKRVGGNRSVMGRSIRLAAVATIFAAFTAPASVPNAPEVFAPASIVVLFETSFQTNGDPASAVWMMISVLPLTFIVVFAACFGALKVAGRRVDSEN
ncbi:MAG: hypothetical protein VX122_08795 [Pseudomonadota bacterium]|nr:hypothetical protein [Pseudomonadota bacterium]MEC8346846.1 hypothetical protein [Pseudomonadota bacterium]